MDTESAASFFPNAWAADLNFCTWLDNFLTKEGFLEATTDKKTIISCAEQFPMPILAPYGSRLKVNNCSGANVVDWLQIASFTTTRLCCLACLRSTKPREKNEQVTRLGRGSPIAWQHINFHGRFEFLDPPAPIDLESVVRELTQRTVNIYEALD